MDFFLLFILIWKGKDEFVIWQPTQRWPHPVGKTDLKIVHFHCPLRDTRWPSRAERNRQLARGFLLSQHVSYDNTSPFSVEYVYHVDVKYDWKRILTRNPHLFPVIFHHPPTVLKDETRNTMMLRVNLKKAIIRPYIISKELLLLHKKKGFLYFRSITVLIWSSLQNK